MKTPVFLRAIAAFLLLLTQSAFALGVQNQSALLSLTDIHFNPFDSCGATQPCELVEELQGAPATQWGAILAKHQTKASTYGSDANYPIIESAFDQAGKQAATDHVKFVAVLGDYLAHKFSENFDKYARNHTQKDYQDFVEKTFEFLTAELQRNFPKQDVYMAVGNNDSYAEDYASDPNGQFYQDMSGLWGRLITDKNARDAMQKAFKTGGYYAVTIPNQPDLRLIVLNSVLFSAKAKGNHVDEAAKQEFDWLQQELASLNANHQKALITLHIPVGIDVFASIKLSPAIVELWKPDYTSKFETLLRSYSNDILGVLAGHFHMDFFQVLTQGYPSPIPVMVTPAVSPVFGNNPGFKVYDYAASANGLYFTDFTTYIDPLDKTTGWQKEYSFNQAYQPDCVDCQIINGMQSLKITGHEADQYIAYFGAGTNSQPVSKGKWSPYYWCNIHEVTAVGYKNCIQATGAK